MILFIQHLPTQIKKSSPWQLFLQENKKLEWTGKQFIPEGRETLQPKIYEFGTPRTCDKGAAVEQIKTLIWENTLRWENIMDQFPQENLNFTPAI